MIRKRAVQRRFAKMGKSRLLAVALLALTPLGPASGQTLREALASAYATNPSITAERARLRATREARPQAIAALLPTVTASGAYGSLDDKSVFNGAAFGAGDGAAGVTRRSDLEPLSGQVQAQQTLFAGWRNLNALKVAAARIRSGGARLASVEQRVLLDAAVAYFDVVRDASIFDSNASQASVLARQYEESRARLEVGELTRTDVSQAEARLAGARAALSAAGAELDASRATYAQMIGDAPGALEKAPVMPDIPSSLEDAVAAARLLSPALIAAKENAEAARRGVAIAKGAFGPAITANAGYSYAEEQSAFVLSSEQATFGLRAQMPIFTGGLNLSRVREAKAEADAARASADEEERRAVAQTTAAFQRIAAARSTIAAARAQVEANRTALAGVRRESEVGARTTLDVLDAEQELLNAETTLAGAERDERASIFILLAAMGALTSDSLDIAAGR